MQCNCYKIYEGFIEFISTQHEKRRKRKNYFSNRIGRKSKLLQTRIEQNNDPIQIMREIQFRNAFKIVT